MYMYLIGNVHAQYLRSKPVRHKQKVQDVLAYDPLLLADNVVPLPSLRFVKGRFKHVPHTH